MAEQMAQGHRYRGFGPLRFVVEVVAGAVEVVLDPTVELVVVVGSGDVRNGPVTSIGDAGAAARRASLRTEVQPGPRRVECRPSQLGTALVQ